MNKRTSKKLLAGMIAFALVSGTLPTMEASASKKVSFSNKKVTISIGKSKTLKVKNAKKCSNLKYQ